MLKNLSKPLCVILVLAIAIRLIGINHGLPFIFHPDEPTIVKSAFGINFFPNPKHFDWPHLYIYLNYFLFFGFTKLRNLLEIYGLRNNASIIWNDGVILYLLSRVLTALLGGFTVIPIYLTGKTLFNKTVGLLSALTLAFLPFHVWQSHYALPDVPMMFFLAWAVYFSSRILLSDSVKNYLLAGLFVGLSASCKYNGGLSALTVPLAYILRNFRLPFKLSWRKDIPKNLLYLFFSGSLAATAFFIGTPFALLDSKTFLRTDSPKGAMWQFKNVGSVRLDEHIDKLSGEIFTDVADNVGYVVMFGFLTITLFFLFELATGRKDIGKVTYKLSFLVIPAIFFLWYISGFLYDRAHYYMIAYPYMILLFGYFVVSITEGLQKSWQKYSFIILLLLPLILFSLDGSLRFANGDTRVDLYKWTLAQNLDNSVMVIDSVTLHEALQKGKVTNIEKDLSRVRKIREGYFVVSNIVVFKPLIQNLSFTKLKQVAFFSSYMKRGPDIFVYEFKL